MSCWIWLVIVILAFVVVMACVTFVFMYLMDADEVSLGIDGHGASKCGENGGAWAWIACVAPATRAALASYATKDAVLWGTVR